MVTTSRGAICTSSVVTMLHVVVFPWLTHQMVLYALALWLPCCFSWLVHGYHFPWFYLGWFCGYHITCSGVSMVTTSRGAMYTGSVVTMLLQLVGPWLPLHAVIPARRVQLHWVTLRVDTLSGRGEERIAIKQQRWCAFYSHLLGLNSAGWRMRTDL